MTNMYQVVDTHDKTVVADGFAKRKDAKPVRNAKNKEVDSETRFVVSRGSDHPLGETRGPVPQTKKWR